MLCLLLASGLPMALAQRGIHPPEDPARRLGLALRKIGVEGRLLYVVAHPDDEDNRLLSYLGHGRGIACTLLTLTRGEGGQNALGGELFAALGVLRMQELAAAHRYDGAAQLFGQSYEFGYSFSVEETERRWGREETLRDLVQAIRQVRPHVIVTMPREAVQGGQHHQASALLTEVAFELAATETWPELGAPFAADRIYEQVWGEAPEGRVVLTPPLTRFDPLLGATYRDFGFIARAQHKCQVTGQILDQDSDARFRRFALVRHRGAPPAGTEDLFEGLAVWRDAKDGSLRTEALATSFEQLAGPIDPTRPATAAKRLREVLPLVAPPLQDGVLRALAASLPALLEARLGEAVLVPGTERSLRLLLANRSAEDFAEARVMTRSPLFGAPRALWRGPLRAGEQTEASVPFRVPTDHPSTAVQLDVPRGALDRLDAADPHLPRSAAEVWLEVETAGRTLELLRVPVHAVTKDEAFPRAVDEDAVVLPLRSANFTREVIVYAPNWLNFGVAIAIDVELVVRRAEEEDGELPEVPAALVVREWGEPAIVERIPFSWPRRSELRRFEVFTPVSEGDQRGAYMDYEVTLELGAEGEAPQLVSSITWIAYPHIRPVHWERPARTRVIAFPCVLPKGPGLASIEGTGDQVAPSLRAAGVPITALTREDLLQGDLGRFRTILVGVRAYKLRDDLRAAHPRLLDWVRSGGHLIVLYQRGEEFNSGLAGRGGSPWTPPSARVDGLRISDETAVPIFMDPAHPFFQRPHVLEAKDWLGWVQERSTYHLETKGENWEKPLAFEDPFPLNAGKKDGALATIRLGEGRWTYVGLALFRQIPAGVPGAWLLLSNIMAPL